MISQPLHLHVPPANTSSVESLRVVLIHGIAVDLDRSDRHEDCSPSENLLDVLLVDTSIVELGKFLPDPIRIVDLFIFQRLLFASRWCVPIPVHRLSDTMTDPSAFVFAHDLIRRGFEEITPDAVKNSVKRLRAVFRLLVPTPRDWFIRYEGRRGYLIDLTHFSIEIVHLPQ